MVEFGLKAEKIAKVAGKADREHLYPDKPKSALNRRISIILKRQQPLSEMPDNEIQASAHQPTARG